MPDVFLSLVDNVQETFGLTPIEALAAGLPAVVSDWNGYKETVRDGVDGFRVPTLAPPAGFGEASARDYGSERFFYNGFVSETSSAVSVDLDVAADRLHLLLSDPALRRTMGEAGRKRALEVFDGGVVIRQHAELWDELEKIRLRERRSPRDDARCVPAVPEPWGLFGHYPSAPLSEEAQVFPGGHAVGGEVFQPSLAQLHENPTTRFGAQRRLPLAGQAHVLTRIAAKPGLRVRELREELGLPMEPLVWTLTWLAKYGLVALRG